VMISRAQITQILKVYEAQKNLATGPRTKETSSSSPKDDLKLSFEPQDLERIRQLVQELPDIRKHIVEPLAEKIRTGSYSVDPKEVAEKLLGRLLADRVC